MMPSKQAFERSIREQIAVNQARTPTERFLALCELLDTVRAMAPTGPEARERRLRVRAVREREREKLRAHFRRIIAAGQSDATPSV